MDDISINMSNYRLMVVDAPTMKMRQNADGELAPVVNRNGETQFVVSVFIKPITAPGDRARKGEEITVNLPVDPGEGFEPGTYVELINPVVNMYAIPDRDDPSKIANAGLWFKASGLKPAGQGGLSSAA